MKRYGTNKVFKRNLTIIPFLFILVIILKKIYQGLSFLEDTKKVLPGKENLGEFCYSLAEWEKVGARSCERRDQRIFDIVLVSTGGVGTTSTIEGFKKNWRLNSAKDEDGLKHRPFHVATKELARMVSTNSSVACATPLFIYVFGDVTGSVFSLYKRPGYAEAQNLKTREHPIPELLFPASIEKYVESKVDYLDIENHFHSYIHGGICSSSIPVFFMRVQREPVEAVLEILESFLKNPSYSFVKKLTALSIKPSHYETDSDTSEKYRELRGIYERLQGQLDSLGHLSVAFNGKIIRLS